MASISDHQHHCASNQGIDGSVNYIKIAPHLSNNCPSHHAYAGVRPIFISSKYHKRKGWPRKMEIFCKTLNSSHIFLWLKIISVLLFDGKRLKSQMIGWEFLANQIISRPIIISSDLASHQIKIDCYPIMGVSNHALSSNQGLWASYHIIISSKIKSRPRPMAACDVSDMCKVKVCETMILARPCLDVILLCKILSWFDLRGHAPDAQTQKRPLSFDSGLAF